MSNHHEILYRDESYLLRTDEMYSPPLQNLMGGFLSSGTDESFHPRQSNSLKFYSETASIHREQTKPTPFDKQLPLRFCTAIGCIS